MISEPVWKTLMVRYFDFERAIDVWPNSADSAAEQRDPANFDPTVNLRGTLSLKIWAWYTHDVSIDYDAIDLPVFTCSSRDYVRIKGKYALTNSQSMPISF